MKIYTCPKCKKRNSIRVVYGYPGEEMMKSAQKGEISLGGCIVGRNSPDRFCKTCDATWLSKKVDQNIK